MSYETTALFNFVRSNGEHLQPEMFTVYLTMLNGLSCGAVSAQHCFALLRAFSSYTGSYVSLDHVFNSMKQYADRFSTQGTAGQVHMTAVEQEGMNAVLRLLASLAKWDQTVRISLVEHPSWQPLQTLTSLVACPVPCTLKSEIFNLLANLNKTPEVGLVTWQALEGINIISKPDKQNTKYTQGIILELQKVESRNETYPETRGFLHLLDELTNHPIPDKLQFSYYFNFLIDDVYLTMDKRQYEDPEEKWDMLCDVLHIIHKLVSVYSPETSHVSAVGSEGPGVSVAPGYTVLMHLLHDSPFLHQLLATLHAGFKIMKEEEDVRAAKSHQVDRACLLSLQLLEEGLEKGEQFKKLNSHALLSSLDTLLLGLNPSTKRPDHLLVITTFVSLQLFSPELALSAVNILCSVSGNPSVAKQLCSILTHDPLLSTDILAGFIQRVEVEDWETYEESDILSKEDRNVASSITSSQIRVRILQLILLNISTPAPNLAHFLLGFETRAPISHTVLQDPGIAGNPRTCLHAILYLISPAPTATNNFTCHLYAPRFSQLAYQVLYTLCSHAELSAPTLRYLRSSKDFLHSQLSSVPFFQLTHTEAGSSAAESHLDLSLQHQQSWLLRMVALELHITTRRQQRSHTQKLINLLLSDEKEAPAHIPVKTDVKSFRAVEEEVILVPSAPGKTVKKLSAILSRMDLSEVVPLPLELSYFNQEQILALIQQHQAKSDLVEMRVIDIKSLHRCINREMGMANIGLPQKQSVLEEMRQILAFALEQNQAREQTEVKRNLFESWNQITDTLLLSCPEELLPRETRFPLLLELANIILEKTLSANIIVKIIPSLTGSLLTIFSHLACIHKKDSTDSVKSVHLDTPAMRPLLTSILDLLSHTDKSVQKTRINLYGVLLYYFQMCRLQDDGESEDIYMRESRVTTLESMTMSLFNSYGDSLVEVVCRDAFDSTNIIQNLSFSLLEQIILFDEDVHWLKTINILGYLRHIVNSIGQQDSQLIVCVRQGSASMDQFFYEAKISFLTRVAMCIKGPELLSQANLFYTLSNMGFIGLRPEAGVLQPVTPQLNSKSVLTYSQLFLPLLRLLLTVLSTAAKRHYDIIYQVTQFVNSHSEVIFSVLRSQTNTCTFESLKELSLVSSLVSLSCAHYMQHSSASTELEATFEPLKALCLRVQRLILNLLPTYCFKSNAAKLVEQLTAPEASGAQSLRREASLWVLQIANSILRYAAVTMNRDGLDMEITPPVTLFNTDVALPIKSTIHATTGMLPPSALSIGSLLQIINDHSSTLMQEFEKLDKIELSLTTRIIESSLYLLWRHVEFYLMIASDKALVANRYQGDPFKNHPTSPHTVVVVQQSKFYKFKQELQNSLTEDFFTQLQQVEDKISEPGAPLHARFIDTSVQNIKKLLLQKT